MHFLKEKNNIIQKYDKTNTMVRPTENGYANTTQDQTNSMKFEPLEPILARVNEYRIQTYYNTHETSFENVTKQTKNS